MLQQKVLKNLDAWPSTVPVTRQKELTFSFKSGQGPVTFLAKRVEKASYPAELKKMPVLL